MPATSTTAAGTEVLDLSPDEFDEYLEREVQASFGVSVDHFRTAVREHRVDWDDPEAFYIAGLLGLNGSDG